MKVLALYLNSTDISCVLIEKNQLIFKNKTPLKHLTFPIWKSFDIDPSSTIIAGLLPEINSLYKETKFEGDIKCSLKNAIKFYEKSLFPVDDKEAYYTTTVSKSKKSFLLGTTCALKECIDQYKIDLASYGLNIDYLGAWQKSFQFAVQRFFPSKDENIYLYEKDANLFVFIGSSTNILFSTIIPVSLESALEGAFKTIKSSYFKETTKVICIGNLDANISLIFTDVEQADLASEITESFLLFGCALAAAKNHANLIKTNNSSAINLDSFKKKLTLINLCLSGLLFLGISCKYLFTNNSIRSELIALENKSPSAFVTRTEIISKKLELASQGYLSRFLYELPEVSEILAFFSAHPVLNFTDSKTGKSASCQELDYEIIDTQTLKVKLACQFPSTDLKENFEKDLKLKKISFKSYKSAHLTIYDFVFKKGFVF